MTRKDAIEDAYSLSTGKAVDISSIPTDKRDLLTKFAMKFYREWQLEPGMEWDSLYQVIGGGSVTATDTFTLDTDINFVATQEQHELNTVRILLNDDMNYINYTLVKPGELYLNRYQNAVAHIPSTNSLKFSRKFVSGEQAFGGSIQVPAIIKLDDINSDGDDILLDDPEWLSWRMAAQYVFSFKSLRDMYDDLLNGANDRMQGMIGRNGSGNDSTSSGVDYFYVMGNVGDEGSYS